MNEGTEFLARLFRAAISRPTSTGPLWHDIPGGIRMYRESPQPIDMTRSLSRSVLTQVVRVTCTVDILHKLA